MSVNLKTSRINSAKAALKNVDKFAGYLNSSTITPESKNDEGTRDSRVHPIELRR